MDLRHQSIALKKLGAKEKAEWKHMERGWVHGSKEFRDRLLESLLEQGKNPEELEQKREISEAAAGSVLAECLNHFGLEFSDLPGLAKSDPRKFLIAGLLRYHYPVRAQWVSEKLVMGHFTTVSRAMKFYGQAEGEWLKQKTQILTRLRSRFMNRR
jgi:hypothetical protein